MGTLLKLSLIPLGISVILAYQAFFMSTQDFPVMTLIWSFGMLMVGGFMISIASDFND